MKNKKVSTNPSQFCNYYMQAEIKQILLFFLKGRNSHMSSFRGIQAESALFLYIFLDWILSFEILCLNVSIHGQYLVKLFNWIN